jgi:hypothetical protein
MLGRFITAAQGNPSIALSDRAFLLITSHLPGPCICAALPYLSPLATAGNRAAVRLIAAMSSPTAPPGGEP